MDASRGGPDCEDISAGEIYAIYVHPDHWRRGASKALMDVACQSLWQKGYKVVQLWVLADNVRAETVYLSQGWTANGVGRQVELRPTWGPAEGVSIQEVQYVGPLAH
ncbi:N-acetyltransferase [Ferrimicrobium sp.]|uniref:GNAT family N-acetyltransferase n=1 Tax=Ferrimicrobium sp. TaxID=2926050 RepID=UPI002624C06A|nr:GNAT family N-acetyltransferase [Ferrimicrobium sp.]